MAASAFAELRDPLPEMIAQQRALAFLVSRAQSDDPKFELFDRIGQNPHDRIMNTRVTSMTGHAAMQQWLRCALEINGRADYFISILDHCVAGAAALAAN